MNLTILMPSFDEEKSIGKTISRIPKKELENSGHNIEILIVDGGSSDKTIEIAESMGAKVIRSGKGYGKQYRLGFGNASGEIIITADSDCSYPMEEIPKLLDIFNQEKLDFISTNRFAFMDKDSMAPMNKFGNRVLTFFANLLFSLKLKDSQSGMWVIRKNILKDIRFTSNGMPLSQEIKIEAFRKFKAREVDSSYKKRIGKVKLRKLVDGLDNISNLFKRRMFG